MQQNEFLWVEKYRPKKIKDVIIPERLKKMFREYIQKGTVPNLLLAGTAGIGKTTIAKALLEEIGADYFVINGSLNAGIDVIRNDVATFASSVSFSGGRKYVIFDEADQLSEPVQKALRAFIETFSNNCGFIFTANYKARIIEPLRSRLPDIDISFTAEEQTEIAAAFYKRTKEILETENVKHDKTTVAEVIKKYFPDFRRTLGELQKHANSGIDASIFASLQQVEIKKVFDLLRKKDFNGMRKWCGEHADQDYPGTYRLFYLEAENQIDMKSMPGVIVTMSDYMDKHTRAIDPEINFVAFLTEIMYEASFKGE